MFSSTASVAFTVTGGIQEISALLPLLGTDQCEEHTGSALGKGYLYTGITPISIFGSLGIVKAGFNILVAGIVSPSRKFLGAQHLAHGGFRPTGEVARLMTLDPEKPRRFLAESNIERILEEAHIENVEDLKIDWAEGSLRWNLKMALCTFIISSLGITPYIYLILHSKDPDNPLFLAGWPFPIARIVASSISGIVIQIIIQLRIIIIIKNRMLFIAMDRYMKKQTEKWDQRHVKEIERRLSKWNANRSSEKCLWELQDVLNSEKEGRNTRNTAPPSSSAVVNGFEPSLNKRLSTFSDFGPGLKKNEKSQAKKQNHTSVDVGEGSYDFSPLRQHYKEMKRCHFPPLRFWGLSLADIIHTWTYFFLHIILFLALIASVLGYVGCFNLIQHSKQDAGPILWLALEALLCFIRIGVWAWNPDVDDNKGVAFKISLGSKSPLVTCNIYGDDFESIKEAPVVRSKDFLGEIVSYTGPLPSFSWSDTALYYILTGTKYSETQNANKALYIIISDFKEQTSRLVVKRTPDAEFSFLMSKLKTNPQSQVVTVETKNLTGSEHRGSYLKADTKADTHVLTADSDFMQQLSEHYDSIIDRINDINHELHRTFYANWALQHIEVEDHCNEHSICLTRTQPKLSVADIQYLNHGRLITRRDIYTKRLEKWMTDYMKVYTQELLDELSQRSRSPISKMEEIETNEVEHLIVEARRQIEYLLLTTLRQWRTVIDGAHNEMVKEVLNYFCTVAPSTDESKSTQLSSSDLLKVADITTANTKLGIRLIKEKEHHFTHVSRLDWERMRLRIRRESQAARERILGRKHADPKEGNRIIGRWRRQLDLDNAWGEHTGIPSPKSLETLTSHVSAGPPSEYGAEDYLVAMEKRLKRKSRFLQGQDGELLRFRCRTRFMDWQRRLQLHTAEFGTLSSTDFLRKVSFSSREYNATRKYWSVSAMTKRLYVVGKQLNYLIISDELINEFGCFENLAIALKHCSASVLFFKCKFKLSDDPNEELPLRLAEHPHHDAPKTNLSPHGQMSMGQPMSFLDDLSDIESATDVEDNYINELNDVEDNGPLEAEARQDPEPGRFLAKLLRYSTMQNIVQNARFLTGIHFADKTYLVSQGIQNLIQQNVDAILAKPGIQPVCEFDDVEISNYLRRSRPYVLFGQSESSKCTVKFHIDSNTNHTLTLVHSFKTIQGEVDIKLNGRRLAKSKGSRQRSTNDFNDERFHISSNRLKQRPEINIITITLPLLDRHSTGDYPSSREYYLSDVVINTASSQTSGVAYYTGNLFTEPEDIMPTTPGGNIPLVNVSPS